MAPHEHHAHPTDAFEGPEEVARVVADGEIALGFVREVVEAVLDLDRGPVRSVLDIGSGPGVATVELARLLPGATVLALDASGSMTEAVRERAATAGAADRVDARQSEIPDGLDELSDVDLVWASMSLHHVGDEVAALRGVRDTLSRHGIVAILEFGDQRRLLPPGDDELADRVEAAYREFFEAQQHHWHGDTPSGELTDMVEQAGLTVLDDHVSVITHRPPLDEAQRRYVTGSLVRARRQLEGHLARRDLRALDRLADDPDRPDAPVVVSRRIVLASR